MYGSVSRSGRPPLASLLAVLGAAVLGIAGLPARGAEPVDASPARPMAAPVDAGALELRGSVAVSPRLSELTVFSPALGRETSLRVLTPAGFDPSTDHLPVLFLLHGGYGDFRNWTEAGQAEALTAGLALIVVMPDGGQGGWYADWDQSTTQGLQNWERYQVDELVPFVQARYRTRTDRSATSIAGLSMGGFGALHHAARHPDVYGFAAAFSGAVDNLHPGIAGVIDDSPLIMGGKPGDIWGRAGTNQTRWRSENPVDLAANLATVQVRLRTGNGQPGGVHGGAFDIQEEGVSQATATLHDRLVALGIDHGYDDYGPGAHSWPYWRDGLVATLPEVLAAAATSVPDPTTVEHLAYEAAFSAWGYDVNLARDNLEPTTLTIRPDGFALSGSGTGTVTTAGRYEPGRRLLATIERPGSGAEASSEVVVDSAGRVTVPVDLGPANELDADEAGTDLRVVRIDVTLTTVTDGPSTDPSTPTTTPGPSATMPQPVGAVAVAGWPRYTG